MTNKQFYKILLFLNFILNLFTVGVCSAAGLIKDPQNVSGPVDVFNTSAGFSSSMTVSNVVQIGITAFLSLLGIIFIILVLYGGYVYMMAAGNEDEVKKATNTIRRAIIGLIIIIGAYAITYFVFKNLESGSDWMPYGG